MPIPDVLSRLRLPVIGSPLFIISNPDMVVAQCRAGIVGSFPALNARPGPVLEEWLKRLTGELGPEDAPFAVNQIVHRSNDRLMHDVELCVKYRAPIVITSLGARAEVCEAVHSYGGIVLHDVINDTFARKAVAKGADGLIAVAAGAGGHAGVMSPFALVAELRTWFDGPVALSGAIRDAGRVERAADDVIANTREILDASAADQDDAMLLQVVSDAGDVCRDLFAVGQTHTRNLTKRRVRLLRSNGLDLRADAATKRVAANVESAQRKIRVPRLRPGLGDTQRGCLDLLLEFLATLTDELTYSRQPISYLVSARLVIGAVVATVLMHFSVHFGPRLLGRAHDTRARVFSCVFVMLSGEHGNAATPSGGPEPRNYSKGSSKRQIFLMFADKDRLDGGSGHLMKALRWRNGLPPALRPEDYAPRRERIRVASRVSAPGVRARDGRRR